MNTTKTPVVGVRRARLTEALRSMDAAAAGPGPAAREAGRRIPEPAAAAEVAVAGTRELREQAWGLVHDAYVSKGYMERCPSKMRLQLQDALPEATTFLARERGSGRALATLTVYPDGALRLPMDAIYRRELDGLRAAGRKPCEIAKLVADLDLREGAWVLIRLFRLAYLTARRLEAGTDLVITVNPRHERYYRRLLMFERIGEEKAYDAVGGAPAVPLRLDLETVEERYHERAAANGGRSDVHDFLVDGAEEATLEWLRRERRPMSADDFRHFFVRSAGLSRMATPSERALIECSYRASDPAFRLAEVPADGGKPTKRSLADGLFQGPGLVH